MSGRVQDSEPKALGGYSGRVCEEGPVDCGECHLGTVLSQQHFAGARANDAVFGKSCQGKGAKKVGAPGIGFKRRKRDMKQRMIGEEN